MAFPSMIASSAPVLTALSMLLCAMSLVADTIALDHDRTIFFDNSAGSESYFHSDAMLVGPSRLDVVNGKCPVEIRHFVSPPNALRLTWTSAPGGDWRCNVRVVHQYGQQFHFAGDSLALWCYATEALTADQAPRIGVQDADGHTLPEISLLAEHGPLAAKKWVLLQVPFSQFSSPTKGTRDSEFDPNKLASVSLVQGLDDNTPHTLLLDDIRTIDSRLVDHQPPMAPRGLQVVGRDSHFDLAWSPNSEQDLLSYRIYRSWDGDVYQPIQTRSAGYQRCVDHVGGTAKTAYYKISAIDWANNESPLSAAVSGSTSPMDDEALLTMVQEACFRYYWEAANPESGMALEVLPGDNDLVAVGASGFGIMALIVGTEREFISRAESTQRMRKIIRFLQQADRFHGVWPHFLSGRTGRVRPYFGKYDNGGDLVETAFLIQGLLAARQYFNGDNSSEQQIRDSITQLWHDVQWDWYRMSPESDVLYWHWSPDHQWHINHPLIGWNETMIVYLLAIASPTHGVPASLYYSGWAGQSDRAVQYRRGWSRTRTGDHFSNGHRYYGIPLDVGSGNGGELFFTQFSFLGFDPRNQRDRFTNYFTNNRNIALINRAYCMENPRDYAGYGPNCWGRSAGIQSGGGRPLPRDDNGTICCSAALGAFAYTPQESFDALKHFYRDLGSKIYGVYGFHDGFNQATNWYDEVYMGLNQAQIVVMIENHRSGLVWRNFMANPEIQPMLDAIGFSSDPGH